jgi:hypothetical protein
MQSHREPQLVAELPQSCLKKQQAIRHLGSIATIGWAIEQLQGEPLRRCELFRDGDAGLGSINPTSVRPKATAPNLLILLDARGSKRGVEPVRTKQCQSQGASLDLH